MVSGVPSSYILISVLSNNFTSTISVSEIEETKYNS